MTEELSDKISENECSGWNELGMLGILLLNGAAFFLIGLVMGVKSAEEESEEFYRVRYEARTVESIDLNQDGRDDLIIRSYWEHKVFYQTPEGEYKTR